MRTYLQSKGIAVPARTGSKTRAGDYAFEITDPDGTLVEFVQSLPDGMEARAAGKFLPRTRVGSRIYHVGFLVGDSKRSLDFYSRVLGFRETWRGSSDGKELSWINLQVPDGEDYIELMLYRELPKNFGGKNHLSLLVPDVSKAVETLRARPVADVFGNDMKVNVGRNGKRQVNLFDPDGTRVELMEATTVSGQPVQSSDAPPPTARHD